MGMHCELEGGTNGMDHQYIHTYIYDEYACVCSVCSICLLRCWAGEWVGFISKSEPYRVRFYGSLSGITLMQRKLYILCYITNNLFDVYQVKQCISAS